jgi:two-component system, chemotaxis family, chemotaxis protein CheY
MPSLADSAGVQVAAPVPTPMRTILIAAGDPDTRALYHAVLDEPVYTIVECDDGAEALGQAICGRPDLIVAEARLARIDGVSLCSLLRTDPVTRSTSIIVITAPENPSEAVRAMIAGADRALAKPFTPDTLASAVRDVWERPATTPVEPAPPVAAATGGSAGQTVSRRRARSRTFRREHTTTPPATPPALHCPSCQSLLVYEHSQTGGVNERSSEQWDYFRCLACGPYQYRHRTRKLRTI